MKYERLGTYGSVIAVLFTLIGGWYLYWRSGTLATSAPVFSWILYGAEIFGFLTAMLHLMMTWRLTVREPPPCREGLSVDVFIPTYNESVDLVRKTLLAARHMDYPHTTWLLDDGHNSEMQALAARLGVRYLARTENTDAKAGNLNNALLHSKADFVAIFDADHAPQKNFLTRTLGYFNDEDVAFVQTPQSFFNLDSYQHRLQAKKKTLWTEQSLFFKVIQRGKDYWNAAFFCGSCAVVRRTALDKIGGFATETITEDLHTSVKLHKAGYKSIYHAETLAYGIAPANVSPFLKQRIRWGQGAMQVLRIEYPFFSLKLTLAQRLNYLASLMTYFDGWQKGIFYIAPVIVLVFGIMPIEAGAVDFLIHFLPYYILSFMLFNALGRGYGGILFIEQYNFARFAAFAWATLGLFFRKLRFSVTDKTRDQSHSTGKLFIPQWAALLLNTSAIPFAIVMLLNTNYLPAEVVGFNIFWAVLNCTLAVLMLKFTLKTQAFLRDEYRFPIPLPVVIVDGDTRIYGAIDNISASGCRVYAKLPESARKGATLQGGIYLPSGPLPFKIVITSEITGHADGQDYVKAVGCRFAWSKLEHRDALELFLYGTDLQSKLLRIREAAPSRLLETLRLARVSGQGTKILGDEHWATCALSVDSHTPDLANPLFGLIPLTTGNAAPTQLVTFEPLPAEMRLNGIIFTRRDQIGMSATIGNGEVVENSAGPVYLYALTACILSIEAKQSAMSILEKAEKCDSPLLQSA